MNSFNLWLQAIINGIALGWLYVLMALGLTLILSIMGILQLAHGEIYMLGAFAVYYLAGLGMGLYPAIAVGMVLMAAFRDSLGARAVPSATWPRRGTELHRHLHRPDPDTGERSGGQLRPLHEEPPAAHRGFVRDLWGHGPERPHPGHRLLGGRAADPVCVSQADPAGSGHGGQRAEPRRIVPEGHQPEQDVDVGDGHRLRSSPLSPAPWPAPYSSFNPTWADFP